MASENIDCGSGPSWSSRRSADDTTRIATAVVRVSGDSELAWNITIGNSAEMHKAQRAIGARRIATNTRARNTTRLASRPTIARVFVDAPNGRSTANTATAGAYGTGEYQAKVEMSRYRVPGWHCRWAPAATSTGSLDSGAPAP